MRLEPVYLVAPRRKVTTRRAFVWAGLTGIGCLVGGLAGGFALGRATSPAADSGAAESGQAVDPALAKRIQWANDLAASGDRNVLLANQPAVLGVVHEATDARADTAVMWSALRALAEALVARRASAAAVQIRTLEQALAQRTGDSRCAQLAEQLRQMLR